MTKRIVIVFCEGHHDVMFLYRLLKSKGYTSYNKKISEFPYPLRDFLISEIKQTSVEELSLEQVKQRLIPTEVMLKDENSLLILYAIGGDTKKNSRKKIIETVKAILVSDPDAYSVVDDLEISLVYFFDADSKGIERRLSEINTELQESFEGEKIPVLSDHQTIVNIKGLKFGAYIFSEEGTDYGKLEDIVLPMMEIDNEEIFNEARKFLELNERVSLFKDHLRRDSQGRITKVRDRDFDLKKSIIGVSGQLQISGKPNGVYIRESAYLDDSKLEQNGSCVLIVDFFSTILNS